MGLILLIISFILSLILYPIGFIYSLIRLGIKTNIVDWYHKFDKLMRRTAVAVDITGNIFLQSLLNDTLITKQGQIFGLPGETISAVLGKNLANNTLTFMGKIICFILNKIEKDHVQKAAKKDLID